MCVPPVALRTIKNAIRTIKIRGAPLHTEAEVVYEVYRQDRPAMRLCNPPM